MVKARGEGGTADVYVISVGLAIFAYVNSPNTGWMIKGTEYLTRPAHIVTGAELWYQSGKLPSATLLLLYYLTPEPRREGINNVYLTFDAVAKHNVYKCGLQSTSNQRIIIMERALGRRNRAEILGCVPSLQALEMGKN
ncbi:hypothetical protein J6590_012749 [Homalodisca vitripennis]|nr:hypothetical protein J6590_012749 [Homalodisca vitripennis]